MRATLPLTLLLASLLTACATQGNTQINKHISQKGALKVHPGLLGQPVPPELRPIEEVAKAEEAPMRMDETGLRTQRSAYFDFNSSDMRIEYDPMLQAHARYLARTPTARLRIEGHADERGSTDYNRRLALKRAENVRNRLLSHGATEQQVKIKSLGESKPKLTGHDETSWAENRRADVIYEQE